jgi:two-component system, chemotaxis family, protein-glutamate methylesterase/glutaminase
MIKVLVVDDSALMRMLLTEIVQSDAEFILIGPAPNAFIARDLINQYKPDVITLDVEMPGMDGLTFLQKLMKARPTPVLMISTLTVDGGEATLKALELGAVDFIPKPRFDIAAQIEQYRQLIIQKIKMAAASKVQKSSGTLVSATAKTSSAKLTSNDRYQTKLIAIGASTGGTVAIRQLLLQLPANLPGIVIVQHMPPGFTRTFAQRLDALCPQTVCEAEHGAVVKPGHVYIAAGDHHLELQSCREGYRLQLTDGPKVSGHKPSVDVLFSSVAQIAAPDVVALILTGMGSDGAIGIQQISGNGGYTIAQDEQSCVVFGMPREAIQTGVIDEICALENMGTALLHALKAHSL